MTIRVGSGRSTPKSIEQRHENRNDLPQQQRDHASRDADQDRDRIDHRGLHRALQLDVLFNVGGEALQNGVENTARFSRFHHVVRRAGRTPCRTASSRRKASRRLRPTRAYAGQNLLEGLVFLLAGQNLQALHQRQAGVDHHRELARENGQFLGIHAAAEGGDVEFLALLRELADVDLLALEQMPRVPSCCSPCARPLTVAPVRFVPRYV